MRPWRHLCSTIKNWTIREVKDYLAERNVPVRREGER